MKNTTYNKWLKRVQNLKQPWTENEIIYFRKAVGQCGIKDVDARYNLIYDVDNIHRGQGYRITKEQTEKGINYLRNTIWRRNGSFRQTAKSQAFGVRERAIIQDFREFRFMGLYRASDNAHDFFTPIYRVIAKNGAYFDYTTNMGQMTVLN